MKGFEVGAWHGIYAPKGTPDGIIQKLSKTLQEALRDRTREAVSTTSTPRPSAAGSGHAGSVEGTIDQRGRSLGTAYPRRRSSSRIERLSALKLTKQRARITMRNLRRDCWR